MTPLDQILQDCGNTLRSATAAVPTSATLSQEIIDAKAAQARGYYLPDEDERLREVFARYLELRAALRSVVQTMEPWVEKKEILPREQQLKVFIVGFTAACYIVRSGHFLINFAQERPVVRDKLDEGEICYNIPRKSFTQIFRLQSSVRRMWKFHEAHLFYQENRDEVLELESNKDLSDLVQLLRGEEPFMEKRSQAYWKHRFHYRFHAWRRRRRSSFNKTMFHLFEVSGRTISELRDPTTGLKRSPKRAVGKPCADVKVLLEPGDVIITRHKDALSNLFLPGFWPHGALFVGEVGGAAGNVVEAKKDGVKVRELEETLTVDAFVVLRANLPREHREEAARRALGHVGKLYDFAFDFRQSERLACTALIYRSWHSVENIRFNLIEAGGRLCLSAEELISQGLSESENSEPLFKIAAFFGPEAEEIDSSLDAKKEFLKTLSGGKC